MDFIAYNVPSEQEIGAPTVVPQRRSWRNAVSAAFILCLVAVIIGAFALTRARPQSVAVSPSSPNNVLTAVSMLSPTEGWAVANPYNGIWDLNLPKTWHSSTVYHYAHGLWLPQPVYAPAFVAVHLLQLHMLSATDGWALGDAIVKPGETRQVVMHYDGQQWSPIDDARQAAPDQVSGFTAYGGFQVISDASLWVASFVLSDSAQQTQLPAVGHLINGHTWKLEYLPLPYKGVNINLNVLSLAMVNDDEGWLAARISLSTDTAGPAQSEAVLYHRIHGKWSIDTTIKNDFDYFSQIAMTSASDGWAIGQQVSATNVPSVLLYHYHQGKWAAAPPAQGGAGYYSSSIFCGLTAQSGWILTGAQPIYTYTGTQWRFAPTLPTETAPPTTLDACSFASPDDGWAVGFGTRAIVSNNPSYYPLFLHLRQGQWSVYTP